MRGEQSPDAEEGRDDERSRDGEQGRDAERARDTEQGRDALVVEVVFHVCDERHGRSVAERMIDRAQEIANETECECDLDVSVRWRVRGAEDGDQAHGDRLPLQ